VSLTFASQPASLKRHPPGHMPITSEAIIRPRPLADPDLRLIVLHHAGGSHMGFRQFARLVPTRWETCLVDAPGRGRVAGLSPRRTMEALIKHLLAELEPLTDRPFAVFGHSMGALVGFALAAELAARGAPLPVWLGVSAHPGPQTCGRGDGIELHRLGPGRLRAALHEIGGTPPELLTDDLLWSQIEPRLRADLQVAEQWRPGRIPRLPLPLTAFCGQDDLIAGPVAMQQWASCTQRFLGVSSFEGGHFYFQPAPNALIARIVADVSPELCVPADSASASGHRY
jgi:surfactin synthase thioesterase subunit